MTHQDLVGAEAVAIGATRRRVDDPLPGRGLHQLAQHDYKPKAGTDGQRGRADCSTKGINPTGRLAGDTSAIPHRSPPTLGAIARMASFQTGVGEASRAPHLRRKIAGLNPLFTGNCGWSRLRSTTKSPRRWGSREGADRRRAGEPRLASAVTIPFIAMAVKNRPVILLGWRADSRSPRGTPRYSPSVVSQAQGVAATVVVLGVGTCESAVFSPGAGRLLWMAPITAAGPSPATPATERPRSWACSLVACVRWRWSSGLRWRPGR